MATETIAPHQALDEEGFQKWMADVKIIRRTDIPTDATVKKSRPAYTAGGVNDAVLDRLIDKQGFLVSREDVSRVASPHKDERDAEQASHWVSNARLIMEHPEYLKTFKHAGCWSIGVDQFNIMRDQIPLLYSLWRQAEQYVMRADLAIVLFGKADPANERIIREQMNNLSSILKNGTDVEIHRRKTTETKPAAYQLHIKTDQKGDGFPPIDAYAPPYLLLDFQRWLSHKDVKILQKNRKPTILETERSLGQAEQLVASALSQFGGFVVPIEYLSMLLYDKPDAKDKVINILQRLRAKVTNGNLIYSAGNVGYAKDIKRMKVPFRIPLVILHTLRKNEGDFVTLEEITRQLELQKVDVVRDTVTRTVRDVQTALAGSSYSVTKVENRQRRELAYRLRRQELIFPRETCASNP